MTRSTKYGCVSKICGIIYGETESPNEGACLRCDEPPVLLQLRLQMGRGPVQAPAFLSPVVKVL